MHVTVQAAAYEHLVNLARKEKERKRKGEYRSVDEKGADMGGVYQGLWTKPPHELHPVGEKK